MELDKTDDMLEEAGERGIEISRFVIKSLSSGGGVESISTIDVCLSCWPGEFGALIEGDIGYLLDGIVNGLLDLCVYILGEVDLLVLLLLL